MHAHEISELLEARRRAGERYHEFLRVPSLSLGIYELPKGGRDPQSPHQEDEVYYVVRGRAMVRVGSEDCKVRAGSIIYVPARTEHRFHHIVERLSLFVVFAPAETSDKSARRRRKDTAGAALK
jgi:mannose-6-phosphate isomerase-like protein (cupin superfamily)